MKRKEWTTVIVVVIVVAIVTSLLTANLVNKSPSLSPINSVIDAYNVTLPAFESNLIFTQNSNHKISTPGNLFVMANTNGDVSYTDLFLWADPLGKGNGAVQIGTGKQTGIFLGNNGNVGIGTTTPTSKLSVKGGDIDVDGYLTVNKGIYVDNGPLLLDGNSLGYLDIRFSAGGSSGDTMLSASGFFQNYSESMGSGSIQIGGDNIIIAKKPKNQSETKSILSPGSVYVGGSNGVVSSRLTHEYLQFSQGNSSMYCYPNFVTKTLNCR